MFRSTTPCATGWAAVLWLAAAGSGAAAQSSCPRVEMTLVEPSASSETRPVKDADETIFVRRSAITTTSDISEIEIARDDAGDDADVLILIKYTPDAAARLFDATTDRDGQRMALVVDDEVWLAFMWRGPYGIGPSGTQLSVLGGMARAQTLMQSIQGCTAG